MNTIRAIIFDLDGVICFTDQYHYQAWKEMADAEGIYFDETINGRLRGVSRMESLDIILEKASREYTQEEKEQLAARKNESYVRLLEKMSPDDLSQEVKKTLEILRQRGYKLVVVLAVCIAIFDYTKFGYDYNALKNGQKVAVNTGIKEISNAIGCYVICGGLMGIVGFLNATRSTTINGGQLNFSSISIMFTAFLPMFIGSYISRFTNEKIGFLLAALCMSMLNSTFAVFSNEVNASMQAIINAVLLVVFLIYLSNEHLLVSLFNGKRK